MATILRSSKYIRCLNCLAQRIVVAHDKSNFAAKSLAVQARCINSYLTKSYATIPAAQSKEVVNFDNIFNQLDFKVQRYGRVFFHEIEQVLAKVRDSGYIPSQDALLLIRCCGDLVVDTRPEERCDLVQEIWSTLNMLKIPMDISHFNALLRVYLENGYNFSPIDFLTDLKEKGLEPNRITYQRLITHYCNQGDIEGATKILEVMREKDIPLNESVFNALITGHSQANDMENAKNVINLMADVGIEPGAKTYCALFRAYAKRGDIEAIMSSLKEINAKDLSLQDKDYLDIIHALAENGHNDKVDEIVALMPNGPGYNADAVHAILKVLDVGNVDVAMKILATMRKRTRTATQEEDEHESASGTFLIRKLVNSKYPAEKIVKACIEMERQGFHNRAFEVAVERSLENGDVDLSLELLKAWKEHGGTIREHYFWPLIVARGKSSNFQGIYDVLQLMAKDFDIKPSFETIKDYVLPYTVGKWDETIGTMKEFRVPHDTIVSAIANRMLVDKKIRKTTMFMMSYPVDYEAEQFYRPLAEALAFTGDAKSYVIILRYLYDSAVRIHEKHGNDEKVVLPETVLDNAVRSLLEIVPTRKAPHVDDVLSQMVEAGFTITPELGERFRGYFQENATPETYAKIEKLTSGSLELVPIADFHYYNPENPGEQLNFNNSVGSKLFAVKRRELAFTLRTGNIVNVKRIVEELEELDFQFSPAVCAQLIDVACVAEDLEMAEEWVKKLRQEHPGDGLDIQKATRYASLLIAKDRFDDALQFILERQRTESPDIHPPTVRRLVKNLLDDAAETGNVEKTDQLFEALVESNYASVDNFMLGPLVKVHLINNNLQGALEAFQKACVTYQCTPLKNELSKKFIDTEDANSLQRLTDLSTQIHGESNSLTDLVLSFLECGRSRQARKILETPGLKLRSKKLRACAERYLQEGKIERLEQFVELTKNLQIVDRQELYDVFLEAYNKTNDWQRGLSLWTEMQDEDIQPSDEFLASLADLLIRNKQGVPFIYSKVRVTKEVVPEAKYFDDVRRAIEQGDLETAEKILSTVSSKDRDLSTAMSELVEQYVKQNDLDKACKLLDTLLLKHARQPRASCLKAVWNALIENKQFDKLRAHANNLSTTCKKNLRFQKYLNRAALLEVGINKCLDDLDAQLTDSKNDNMVLVMNTLHFTTFMEELKKNPTAFEKFKPIAEKLGKQRIYLPINMMWCYYFEKNLPEADDLWARYLSDSHWIVFNYLIEQSMKNQNLDLLERLNETVWTSRALSLNAKMSVLASLIEMYTATNRLDEAVDALKGTPGLDIICFKKMHPKAFQDLKDSLESSGKAFPLEVPDTRQQDVTESKEEKKVGAVE